MAGERRAPPEDCGGLPGFYEMLGALADLENEQHDDLREWLGGDFDEESFSVDAVNQRLRHLRPQKKRVPTQ